MLQFAESAGALVGGEAHKDNVLRPLTARSIDRWKTELTGRQIAIAEQITWNEMPRWGYQHLSTGLGLTDRIAVRARYLLQRASNFRRPDAGKRPTGPWRGRPWSIT